MSAHPVPTLIYEIIQDVRARNLDRPALVGVGGAQGSGKSTVCWLLAQANRPRFAHFSLDDVYWPRAQREQLAVRTHPLFVTRGPPGTHDLNLARYTIAQLRDALPDSETPLPRYDKVRDEPMNRGDWPLFVGRPEAILVEAWCMGALAPNMGAKPLNAIEAIDSAGVWRQTQVDFLQTQYAPFFEAFDAIVYLQAPSWEIVRTWRGQQEAQALGRPLTDAENAALDRFVMHYERLTRSMLASRHSAGWIVRLDEARNVTRIEKR